MSFNPCSFSFLRSTFRFFRRRGLFFSFSFFAAVAAVSAGKGKGERGNKIKTSKLHCSQAPGSVSPQQYYYSLLCAINHSGQTALPNVFQAVFTERRCFFLFFFCLQSRVFCVVGDGAFSLSFSFSLLPLFSYSALSFEREEEEQVEDLCFRMKRRRRRAA